MAIKPTMAWSESKSMYPWMMNTAERTSTSSTVSVVKTRVSRRPPSKIAAIIGSSIAAPCRLSDRGRAGPLRSLSRDVPFVNCSCHPAIARVYWGRHGIHATGAAGTTDRRGSRATAARGFPRSSTRCSPTRISACGAAQGEPPLPVGEVTFRSVVGGILPFAARPVHARPASEPSIPAPTCAGAPIGKGFAASSTRTGCA